MMSPKPNQNKALANLPWDRCRFCRMRISAIRQRSDFSRRSDLPAFYLPEDVKLVFKLQLGHGQDIFFPCNPHVERGQEKDVDGKSSDQPSDDDDGERPLRV